MPDVTSIGTDTYLFADDTKAFRGIYKQSDCAKLQTDIHALQECHTSGSYVSTLKNVKQ